MKKKPTSQYEQDIWNVLKKIGETAIECFVAVMIIATCILVAWILITSAFDLFDSYIDRKFDEHIECDVDKYRGFGGFEYIHFNGCVYEKIGD